MANPIGQKNTSSRGSKYLAITDNAAEKLLIMAATTAACALINYGYSWWCSSSNNEEILEKEALQERYQQMLSKTKVMRERKRAEKAKSEAALLQARNGEIAGLKKDVREKDNVIAELRAKATIAELSAQESNRLHQSRMKSISSN